MGEVAGLQDGSARGGGAESTRPAKRIGCREMVASGYEECWERLDMQKFMGCN